MKRIVGRHGAGGSRVRWSVAAALAVATLAACSGHTSGASSSPSSVASPGLVSKVIYASAVPAGAKGEEQYLYAVAVPPGTTLAPHTHPGTQLANIQGGTLTYTVISGTVTVIRHAGTDQEQREQITGQTVDLHTGDSVIESPGMVHSAENRGSVPVRIVLSALFPKGAEMSSPAPRN